MSAEGMARAQAPEKAVDVQEVIDDSRMSRLQYRVVVLCALVSVLEGYDIQAMAFVASSVRGELGLSASNVGLLFGTFVVGLGLGNTIVAPIADRLGRRRILVLSTLIFGVAMLATMWCESLTALLLARLITGIGVGGAGAVTVPMVSEYSPPRIRSTTVMATLSGLTVGAVLGGLLAGQIIPTLGWRWVFAVGGTGSLLIAVLVAAALPESLRFLVARGGDTTRIRAIIERIDPSRQTDGETSIFISEESGSRKTPFFALFTEGRAIATLVIWAAMFAFGLVMYFLLSWVPSLLEDAGLPLSTAVLGGTLYSLGGLIGSITLGWLIDRTGRPAMVLSGASVIAIVAILTVPAMLPGVALTAVALLLLGVGTIGTQIGVINLSSAAYPTLIRSTGVGWAYGVGRVGSILGPVLGGLLISSGWSTQDLFTAVAVPAAVGLVTLLTLGWWNQRVAAHV